jgi:hypothetical protein
MILAKVFALKINGFALGVIFRRRLHEYQKPTALLEIPLILEDWLEISYGEIANVAFRP